jgi:hypothetical protein
VGAALLPSPVSRELPSLPLVTFTREGPPEEKVIHRGHTGDTQARQRNDRTPSTAGARAGGSADHLTAVDLPRPPHPAKHLEPVGKWSRGLLILSFGC